MKHTDQFYAFEFNVELETNRSHNGLEVAVSHAYNIAKLILPQIQLSRKEDIAFITLKFKNKKMLNNDRQP